jgi:thiol-disulfide isomerase/thioredoxin
MIVRRKMPRRLAQIAAIAVLAAFLWLLVGPRPASLLAEDPRYEAAALNQLVTAKMADSETGEARNLSQWRGKPLVVNFWATWCPPCQRELPDFAALANIYRDRVHFVGIGLDEREALRTAAKGFGLPYPTLIGNGFVLGQTVRLGNPTRGLPFTLVLDARGQPVTHHVGAMSRAALQAAIEQALAATP